MSFASTRWFDNVKIRAKLLMGFATILVILLTISSVAVWSFLSTKTEFEAYSQRVKVVAIARQLDRDLSELRRNAREFGLTDQEDDAATVKKIGESIGQQITVAVAEIKDPGRRLHLQGLSKRFEKYLDNFDRIHKQGDEQTRLIREVLDPSGERFHIEVSKLREMAAKSGNANLSALAMSVMEHGQQARLYANMMLGRRDGAFDAKARAEFQSVVTLLNGSEAAPKDDATKALLGELRSIIDTYQGAFDQLSKLTSANRDLVDNVNANLAAMFAEDAAYIRDSGIEDEQQLESELHALIAWSSEFVGILALFGLALGGILAWRIGEAISRPVVGITDAMGNLAAGKLEVAVPGLDRHDEIGTMALALQNFKEAAQKLASLSWVKSNVADLGSAIQGAETAQDLARVAIATLMPVLGGGAGVVYLWNEETQTVDLQGSWGFKKRRHLSTSFRLGEGLVGQAALERTTITLMEVPDDYVRITSGIGEATPRCILVAPIVGHHRILGVIEIASFQRFTAAHEALIEESLRLIALNLEVQDRNQRTRVLLEQTQQQAEELRVSEEELKAQSDQLQQANDELRAKSQTLENQAEELRASEEELKVQREELQAANEELSEKTDALEEQARTLETARLDADNRALERDTASRYKSEFLANMSHELRTPLNSLLILSRSLSENEEGNLSDDQVDSARIILESGTHLLRLINDILDLSKVEAGKMVVDAADLPVADFVQSLSRRFAGLAEAEHLSLTAAAEDSLPTVVRTDRGKLDQIVNNLVGNAIKFTETGSVDVTLRKSDEGRLAVAVKDTGIGIPADKLERIFTAFEQADGSTSRSFGGTGLGLTISRKLAQFLGGDISVESVPGKGSTFTLTLPLHAGRTDHAAAPTAKEGPAAEPAPQPAPLPFAAALRCDDDRDVLSPQDETILVIEDDVAFARIVRDSARKQGFKCLLAQDGQVGIALARQYRPTGIVLDVGLPGMDGWTVMDSLKKHAETRHIPVHFMSATDASRRGLEMGAVGYFTKPVTKEQITQAFERIHHFAGPGKRRLLLVEDDAATRKAVLILLAAEHLEIVEVITGEDAFTRLRDDGPFDCMILDLGLPTLDGQGLLRRCTEEGIPVPPIVVYSARELSMTDTMALREYTDSIVIKGARSPDRLLDEVTLFLHSVQARLPESQQRVLRGLQKGQAADGAVALVVDDDMRNTFALSKVLRAKGFRVLMAQDGRTALDQLGEARQIDVVLMDIMMPGMDGYQATREIRKQERFRTLPIIALTAKAMAGDREKCLEAGADDYVSKPVDMDALLAAIARLVKR